MSEDDYMQLSPYVIS